MRKCSRCNEPSCAKQGHQWLCEKHYRFRQMRGKAQQRGLAVPTYEWLEANVPDGMICCWCKRTMNWLQRDGASTVITLQHDRSGELRLICLACNSRHARFSGDEFYSLPIDKKPCPACKQVLPLSAFCIDRSKRWQDRKSMCRQCSTDVHREWVRRNREEVNAKRRAYYHKRIREGNPIPR